MLENIILIFSLNPGYAEPLSHWERGNIRRNAVSRMWGEGKDKTKA
jgi:hypothetical protein